MTSLVVNPSRLATLLEALDGAALFFVVGETQNLVGNSRSAALLTRLFDAPTTPANVAVLANGTTLHVFAKSGKVSGATVLTSVEAFVAQVTAVAPTLHVFSKELDKQSGAWATVLLASLSSFTASAKDGAAIAARCLAVKDATEKENVRKAGAVTAFAFKRYAIDRLKAALANPTPPSEAALAEDFDYVLNHPKKIPELDKMDDAHFEAAFSPSAVQSNPNHFRLQLREAISGNENSHASVRGPCVTLAMGAKHRGYAVLCARTFLVQPCPAPLIEAYNFLHAVFEHLLSLLVKGSPLKDIHSAVMAFAQRTNASLAAKLVPELGFTTGLHFGDPRGTISPRAESTVQNGTVLVLRVALQGVAANVVKTEDGDQEEQFGLVIADTVIFDNDAVKAATKVDRAPAAITWSPIEVKAEVKKEKEPEVYVPRVTRGAAAAVGLDLEAARKDKIRELLRQKREAWVAAGSPQGVDAANTLEDNSAIGRLSRGAAQCYGSAGIPAEFASKGLSVDRARQALIVPIGGDLVPFHVSTITKATCIPDGKGKTVMTVTFATTQASNVAFARQRNRQWVKELTFVRPDGGFLFDIVAAITEVQKMIKESDAKSKQNSGVAPTEALKLVPGAVRLPTVKMRPAPAQVSKGGSITGNLEAHGNGFRFAFGGQHIDIPYSNIKHFIFQPARKEIVVVLHINLRQPMIIAGKKTEDVQFIAEVLETSVAVGGSRKTHDEELEAEERDNQRVRETNKQFGTFAKKVAEDHGLTLELPIAGESSRFQGVANKKMTWFNVNEHAMWSVSEMPFCVISLDDIEVVALERVLPSQHNFDAMFIHKDYKTVVPVTNIAMIHLEAFKDWLGELGKVVYFESTANIAWTKILKTLRDDKEWEAWGPGGWITYVDPNAGDEEGGDDSDPDDADSDYEEDEESDEDSDDSEEDSEWAEEGSSSDFDSDDSGDSEGSWSSVERKAEVADRKRGYNSDDSDRPKRPRGAGPQVAQRKPPQPAPPRR